MQVEITKTLEIDVAELAAQLSPVEMLELFTEAANHLSDKASPDARRLLAKSASQVLSENAKRMLAEIFAAQYVGNTLKD